MMINRGCIFILISALAMVGCGKQEILEQEQLNITRELNRNYIYQRNNLPDDPPPSTVSGYYDITGGAYRYIENEYLEGLTPRPGRAKIDGSNKIKRGDRISFYFVAKVFSGDFDNSKVFYTNIEDQMQDDGEEIWPTVPLEIKIGDDSKMLPALQKALIGCYADDGDPTNNVGDEDIESDIVRVYLTSDIGFGKRAVYNVPGRSTLVYRITEIQIL